MKKFISLTLATLMLLACLFSCKRNESEAEGQRDSQSQVEVESESECETEHRSETVDTESESEVDIESGYVTESESASASESETESEEVLEDSEHDTESYTEVQTDTDVIDIIRNGRAYVNIIYPEDASAAVVASAIALSEYFMDRLCVYVEALTDKNTDPSEDTFEILVGMTNRRESGEAMADLSGTGDYFVGVVGRKIVLSGIGDAAVTDAVGYLITHISSILEEEPSAENISFSKENNYLYVAKYPSEKFQLLGESIEDYKIVVPEDTRNIYNIFANELASYLYSETGVALEIITDNSATGNLELWVGKKKDIATAVGENEYVITVNGDCIVFLAESVLAAEHMLADSKAMLLRELSSADKRDCGEIARVDVSAAGRYTESPVFNKLGSHRIMYHNIWDGDSDSDIPVDQKNRYLYDTYVEYAPDILCLQEVTPQMRFGEAFPLIEKLCQSGYADATANDCMMTATPILYRIDSYKLCESGVYKFDVGGGRDKFITWAVLEALDKGGQGTGVKIGVLSVHLAYQTGTEGNSYRMQQVPYVLEFANKIMTDHACPVIVGGEFNCTADSAPYKLLAEGGFAHVFDQFPKNDNGESSFCDNCEIHYSCPVFNKYTGMLESGEVTPSGKYDEATDHILFKGAYGLEFKCFRVIATEFDYVMRGSDHSPLLVDFSPIIGE